MSMTTINPYADAYDLYWRAGWRGILPLPYGEKTPPPEGYTGYTGAEPSYADCTTWAEDGINNIALRVPPNVIGLDVDAYDGKPGGDTLMRLVDTHGALPPTYLSTSRSDGMSGIRLYRVPPGTTFPTKLPGIELIQNFHRYAVVWPSRHPNGQLYQWIDERTAQPTITPPAIDAIPELPAEWVAGLLVEGKQQADKANLNLAEAMAILAEMRQGEPCRHILAAAGKAVAGGDRHDSYNEAILAVLGYGRRGCPGAHMVIERLKSSFTAEIADRSTKTEAAAEFRRGLLGAIAIVANEIPGQTCPDEVEDYVRSLDPTQPANPDNDSDQAPNEPSALDLAVGRRLTELVVNERAKEKLATIKAGDAPTIAGLTLTQFLQQPDEDNQYRVQDLWPTEGRVLLAAAAKTGKTTLVAANLIPSLVDGDPFLDRYTTQPVDGRVVLLNMEVGPNTLRGWLRRSGITASDKVIVANLRGAASALQLSSNAGRQRTASFLRDIGTEIVILDPLAPVLASLGLDENSNADVAQFFAWWSETLHDAGVKDDVVVHHTGHAGDRSRGASRLLDEPDAIWTLTRGRDIQGTDDDPIGQVGPRYLGAYGRDVDLAPHRLHHNPDTHRLTMTDELRNGANSDEQNANTYGSRIIGAIKAKGDGLSASQMSKMKDIGASQATIDGACKHLIGARKLESYRELRRGNWVDVYCLPGHKSPASDASDASDVASGHH